MTEDTRSASDGFMIRDARELGLAVRALRRSRGWTQADLSRVAGISRPALIRLERGESVRVSTLMDALTFLGARIRVVSADAKVTGRGLPGPGRREAHAGLVLRHWSSATASTMTTPTSRF